MQIAIHNFQLHNLVIAPNRFDLLKRGFVTVCDGLVQSVEFGAKTIAVPAQARRSSTARCCRSNRLRSRD